MAPIVDDLRQYVNISQECMPSSHIHGNIYLLLYIPLGTTEAIHITVYLFTITNYFLAVWANTSIYKFWLYITHWVFLNLACTVTNYNHMYHLKYFCKVFLPDSIKLSVWSHGRIVERPLRPEPQTKSFLPNPFFLFHNIVTWRRHFVTTPTFHPIINYLQSNLRVKEANKEREW